MGFVFELERNSAIMNFTAEYCQTHVELLESTGFNRVLSSYLDHQERKGTPVYRYLIAIGKSKEKVVVDLTQLFKVLLVLDIETIEKTGNATVEYFTSKALLLEFVEKLYNYWRRLGRYAIAFNNHSQSGIQNQQFIETHNRFENLVLETYRQISEELMGKKNRVYRQLIAGVNAGLIVNQAPLPIVKTYPQFKNIATIESIILHPPFITYPKMNTRTGIFTEVFENPLQDVKLKSKDYFCFPARVGKLLAFVYFHKDFLVQGLTLCNLFELAEFDAIENQKPDLVYVYGVKDDENKTVFYNDLENDMYIGYVSYSDQYDYFGYMKKMILTLHNVKMLDKGGLPLHGAMAHITLHSGAVKNVVIIGDSGAGKSETIEALRNLDDKYIKDIKIVFDDMGVLVRAEDQLVANGTEIGAFVRLDDLDPGYAYKEIDRSIFMNPHLINSRLVMPVATYEEITTNYPVDLLLYANNYDEEGTLSFFDNIDDAKQTFVDGARMAKGTTSETGLVTSYFANPFGPVQRKAQTDNLIESYFNEMFEKGVKIGQLKTKLGIHGNEHTGPKEAAEALLEYLIK
ncbi:MAG: phosphoenolpyruvate carboxykinase [Culicoidibacterales bacterium]